MEKVVPLIKIVFYLIFSSTGSPSFNQINSNQFENFQIIRKHHCSFQTGPRQPAHTGPRTRTPPPFGLPCSRHAARPATTSTVPTSCCPPAPFPFTWRRARTDPPFFHRHGAYKGHQSLPPSSFSPTFVSTHHDLRGTPRLPGGPIVHAGAEVCHRRHRSRSHRRNYPLSVSSLDGSPCLPSLISRCLTPFSLPWSCRCDPPPPTTTRARHCAG
jgi:hypothetical protein